MTEPLREPLDERTLAERVLTDSHLWRSVEVVESLTSSNAVMAERARAGAAAGVVLIAEEQTAGRGRHDRGWSAPQYSSVMTSVLLRPQVAPARWGWVPLITALAVVDALEEFDVEAMVKWPNDVLVGDRKVAGVLCEVVPTPSGAALVAGWGVNVDQREHELPVESATSVLISGGRVDRLALACAVLIGLEHWYRGWEADSAELQVHYRERSSTLGREVALSLPGGAVVAGRATGLADSGGLVVDVDGTERVVAAADVVHLRPGMS